MPNPANPYYTQYGVQISSSALVQYLNYTNGTFNSTLMFASTTTWGTPFWINNPLTPNTTYTISTIAQNILGVTTGYSLSYTTVTLSNPPLASAYGVWVTSITANWQNNSNPAGTYYTAQNMTIGNSSKTMNNVWISTGLIPNTTYQFQVNSQNYSGIASSWVSLGSTVTLAAVPPALTMGNVYITSATVTINPGTNPYWTQYAIQVSSNVGGIWTGYVASPTGGFSSTAVYNTTTTWTNSVSGNEPVHERRFNLQCPGH